MQELFKKNNREFINWLKHQWNIEFECVRSDIDIQGSPERTLSRCVIEDKDGNCFLLEKFSSEKFSVRKNVARAIEHLNDNGLKQALSYNKSNNGEFLPFFKDACFQVSSFLTSTGIKRPDYLASSEMGESFAFFLIHLSRAPLNMEEKVFFEPFSIKKYIYKLFNEIRTRDAGVYKQYVPFLEFLEKNFMKVHDKLPVSFCHGDLHPLNVIWNHNQIKAVIDWEFAGFKPDIYDAANLVGCAGIEDPEGLGMPMVMTFLETLKKNNTISQKGWDMFPEYVLALRFAWLSEWLRKKDKEMLELEACYLEILMDNMDTLRKIWKM